MICLPLPAAHERSIVMWAEDKDVPLCPFCARTFNLARRRHHCRLCGGIMCDECSQFLTFDYASKCSLKLFFLCFHSLNLSLYPCFKGQNCYASPFCFVMSVINCILAPVFLSCWFLFLLTSSLVEQGEHPPFYDLV